MPAVCTSPTVGWLARCSIRCQVFLKSDCFESVLSESRQRLCRSGVRLNTREMRVRNAMRDRRLDLIEEMIKRQPSYKPPIDYKRAAQCSIPAL